jgi:hypothetical protein
VNRVLQLALACHVSKSMFFMIGKDMVDVFEGGDGFGMDAKALFGTEMSRLDVGGS